MAKTSESFIEVDQNLFRKWAVFDQTSLSEVESNLCQMPDLCQMTVEDYSEVVEIWKNTKGVNLSSAESKEVLQRFLQRNEGLSFVVRDQGKIVAAVLCGHDGLRGYIHHLAVLPEYRRKGIAKSLVINCVSGLSKLGLDRCNIVVAEDNLEGEIFWKTMGWWDRNDAKIMFKVF